MSAVPMNDPAMGLPDPAVADDVLTGNGLGRRGGVGLLLAAIGLISVLVVAPNLVDETRSFRFEQPPDPAQFSFNPRTLATVIGVIYLAIAAISLVKAIPNKWASRAQIVAAILFVPLILGMALGRSGLAGTNVINLLNESLILATPLALGAMTGLWSERVGIINIGIEGMMLSAAGVGFMTYALVGDASSGGALFLSVIVAVLVGGLLAMLLSVLSIKLGINQIVAGVVINLFAVGMTGFIRSQVIVESGISIGTPTPEILSLIHI